MFKSCFVGNVGKISKLRGNQFVVLYDVNEKYKWDKTHILSAYDISCLFMSLLIFNLIRH